MAKAKNLNVLWPLGGLNRRYAYRQQPPYTTPDALNVRPVSTLEGRERGGSRPGLMKSHIDDLGSNIYMLKPMTLALGDGFTVYSDTFNGTEFDSNWAQASWASDTPNILSSALASIDTSVDDGSVVHSSLTIDSTEAYTVELYISPYAGAHHGTYYLYFRMDDTTPDITDEGVMVTLTMTGTDGSYSGSCKSYVGGVATTYTFTSGNITTAQPGWLTAIIDGDDVTIYWHGVKLLNAQTMPTSHTGLRVGFGMDCSVSGGVCLANVFRCQYYSTGNYPNLRTKLIASCGGNLYQESTYGRMTVVTSDLTVRSDVPITACQSGQKLYIADYGDLRDSGTDGTVSGSNLDDGGGQDWTSLGIDTDSDVCVISNVTGNTVAGTYTISSVQAANITLGSAPGDGTCSYRIERGPKIYNPATDTITLYTAASGKGQVPTGCPLICNYLDRIVLAGAEIAPHAWYMARKSDETDWDYTQTDSEAAVAGTSSDAGQPGDPITALVPHSDDYLVIGSRNSLWLMRGDPAFGGSLDALSRTVGIVRENAWCFGPAGELVFVSLDGLYILPPGGQGNPIPLSKEVLPQEFKNIDPNEMNVLMEYDTNDNGIHIYLISSVSNQRYHWWFDWQNKTFWPVQLASDHEPTATCTYQSTVIEDSGVILGGRDGYLRRFTDLAENDDGTSITSYIIMGPIGLGPDSFIGKIQSLDAVMASNSGDVTWSILTANTFEGTVNATASDTGTWSADLNARDYPVGVGQAFCLRIDGASSRRWGFEIATAAIIPMGQRRIW